MYTKTTYLNRKEQNKMLEEDVLAEVLLSWWDVYKEERIILNILERLE